MNWYIFSTRDEQQRATLEIAISYRRAVDVAQEEVGSGMDERPKRVFEGMYKIRNSSPDNYRARYIVREDAMSRYGFGHLLPERG